MKHFLAAAALALLAGCAPQTRAPEEAPPTATPATPVSTEAPSGAYTLDKAHATLLFRVNHLGFSWYTGRFTRFDAALQLDTANPGASTLTATVDPASLTVENPPRGFEAELRGPNWLDAGKFREITFKSTAVELTGPDTAKITGDFTMHGVTKPVVLDAKFNGGYAGHPMDPNARIGFSAKGTLKRSEYGIAYGVPAPGTTMGVSDDVEVIIEAEFSGPALPATPPAAK